MRERETQKESKMRIGRILVRIEVDNYFFFRLGGAGCEFPLHDALCGAVGKGGVAPQNHDLGHCAVGKYGHV